MTRKAVRTQRQEQLTRDQRPAHRPAPSWAVMSTLVASTAFLHHVRPVTRGARIASFFWNQSMVRNDGERTLLFDLDTAIQRVTADAPDRPAAVPLTGVYHNLLRRWADL